MQYNLNLKLWEDLKENTYSLKKKNGKERKNILKYNLKINKDAILQHFWWDALIIHLNMIFKINYWIFETI